MTTPPPNERKTTGRPPRNPEELLPAITDQITIREFTSVPHDVDEEELKKVDVAIANNMLEVLHFAFSGARTIKSVTSLVSATMRTVEQRRNMIQGRNDNNGEGAIRHPIIPIS